MRAFFHFLVLFTSSRTSALFLFAFAFCFFFFPFVLYVLLRFSFEMVSSEQILGVMTVGRSVLCIPCLVPMCMIYSLMQSTSFSRFLFAKVKWSSVCSLFFSAMCVIDNEVHARTRWLRPRDDFRVDETGYAGERCKLSPSCPFLYSSTIRSFLFLHTNGGNKRISFFWLRNFVRERPNDPCAARSSFLANDGFLARYFDSIHASRFRCLSTPDIDRGYNSVIKFDLEDHSFAIIRKQARSSMDE